MKKRKDVYITSTLKSERNRNFNPLLCQKLEEKGITCHLPQRDTNQKGTEEDKFSQNIDGIKDSNSILAIGINESINRWLEVGYGFGCQKKIILLTDKNHTIPTMSLGMFDNIVRVENIDDIDGYIDRLLHSL